MQQQSDKYMVQAWPDKPYHLSVGLVGVNAAGKVLYMKMWAQALNKFVYLLPTTTPTVDETFTDTLRRILTDKLKGSNVSVTPQDFTYIGSMKYIAPWFGEINQTVDVEKTEVYFKYEVPDGQIETWSTPEKSPDEMDFREVVEVGFMEQDRLAELMSTQGDELSYLDQSEVLKRI